MSGEVQKSDVKAEYPRKRLPRKICKIIGSRAEKQQKVGRRVNGFTLRPLFPAATAALWRPAAAGLAARALPGRRTEKRESQCYHEWNRRSQQRAQCAPAAAAGGHGASVGMHRGCNGKRKILKPNKM